MTDKERDKEDEIIKAETPSTEYTLSGYLDNQADDFPEIHQTWHGAEGDIYYLVSEKGFNRLPTKKKDILHGIKRREKERKKRSCMKSRRFFRQKISGGKAIHRQAWTAKEKQAFSTLQDQILCRKMQTTSGETELCSEVSV